MPVEISRYSFHVFLCAYPIVISSISGKSFHFPFPSFVVLPTLVYYDFIMQKKVTVILVSADFQYIRNHFQNLEVPAYGGRFSHFGVRNNPKERKGKQENNWYMSLKIL